MTQSQQEFVVSHSHTAGLAVCFCVGSQVAGGQKCRASASQPVLLQLQLVGRGCVSTVCGGDEPFWLLGCGVQNPGCALLKSPKSTCFVSLFSSETLIKLSDNCPHAWFLCQHAPGVGSASRQPTNLSGCACSTVDT